MNELYQENALEQLRSLAKQDEPFFLNYWPMLPISFVQEHKSEYNTLNGGTIADSIVELDDVDWTDSRRSGQVGYCREHGYRRDG